MSATTRERSLARVLAALQQSSISQLRGLCAHDDGDRIVLVGQVDSFYHKQLAQELVRAELGDVAFVNDVHVAAT